MHVAHRNTHQQVSLRRAFVLAGAVLMIIIGLLGMHVLSAGPAGHATAYSAMESSHANVGAPAADADTSPCGEACTPSPVDAHSGMVAACVLVLLAGLLLLLRPPLLRLFGSPPMMLPFSVRAMATGVLQRAPSLILLSISRT